MIKNKLLLAIKSIKSPFSFVVLKSTKIYPLIRYVPFPHIHWFKWRSPHTLSFHTLHTKIISAVNHCRRTGKHRLCAAIRLSVTEMFRIISLTIIRIVRPFLICWLAFVTEAGQRRHDTGTKWLVSLWSFHMLHISASVFRYFLWGSLFLLSTTMTRLFWPTGNLFSFDWIFALAYKCFVYLYKLWLIWKLYF